MRVLVTGGREFALADEVGRILNTLHGAFTITELGHGDAEGADTLCKLWALSMGIPTAEYEITQHQWDLYGDRAGNMRNSRMLREFKPDTGVSFPGGSGTADMTTKLIEASIPTLVGTYADINKTTLRWKTVNGKNHG
jgi:hypothetical protein